MYVRVYLCVCVCVYIYIYIIYIYIYPVKTHKVAIRITAKENLWAVEKEDGKAQICGLGTGT